MRRACLVGLAGIVLSSAVLPAQAQSVLEGIIGGPEDDALVTLGSGEAGDNGLVNVGVGNGLDIDIGGSNAPIGEVGIRGGDGLDADVTLGEGIGEAAVDIGGEGGILDADVNLLDDTVQVGLGAGGDSLLDLDVGIWGGDSAGPGGTGVPGGSGTSGGSVNGGAGVANNGAASGCVGMPASQVASLVRSTRLDAAWQSASNVEVQRVQMCPEVAAAVRSELRSSDFGQQLASAVVSDALINASLSRTQYDANDVLAVRHSGSQLVVFVY